VKLQRGKLFIQVSFYCNFSIAHSCTDKKRVLSLREFARAQGFPDVFRFYVEGISMYQQIAKGK
jgi:site-specific DNA-cytosine methylase